MSNTSELYLSQIITLINDWRYNLDDYKYIKDTLLSLLSTTIKNESEYTLQPNLETIERTLEILNDYEKYIDIKKLNKAIITIKSIEKGGISITFTNYHFVLILIISNISSVINYTIFNDNILFDEGQMYFYSNNNNIFYKLYYKNLKTEGFY